MRAWIAAAALALMGTQAGAATIVQTLVLEQGDETPAYDFMGFDSSLGILTGVRAEVSFAGTITFYAQNDDLEPLTITGEEDGEADAFFGLRRGGAGPLIGAYAAVTIYSNIVGLTLPPGGEYQSDPIPVSGYDTYTFSDLSYFTSWPTIELAATMGGDCIFKCSPTNVGTFAVTRLSGEAVLTYTYVTPVPLPASGLLLLGPLALLRVKRRCRS